MVLNINDLPAEAAGVHAVGIDLNGFVVVADTIRDAQMVAACADPNAHRGRAIIFAVDQNVGTGRIAREKHCAGIASHRYKNAAVGRDVEDLAGGAISAGIGNQGMATGTERDAAGSEARQIGTAINDNAGASGIADKF